jgi:aminopeptidase N
MRSRVAMVLLAALATPLTAQQHYQRQPGVDVQHYRWSVTLSDSTDEIVGDALITINFTQPGLRSIFFDLNNKAAGGRRGMVVTAVSADSAAATYTHVNDRVTVALSAPTRAGDVRRFRIVYHGFGSDTITPGGRGGGGSGLWIGKNGFGERAFFSRNWPDAAHSWLPCIDHPSDKATSEFIVIAPDRYAVVANGILQEEVPLGNGQKVTHWMQSVPIATWLNNIGVEQFGIHYAGLVRGVPLQTWAPHQALDKAVASLELTARQSIEFFSENVGPYSYEKMASVAAAGGGGGMEHASAIFYGETSASGSPATSLVAHETAHQWFGDAVTEDEWDDVWLSEGFATYFALLYTEHFAGRDAFLAGVQHIRPRAIAAERQQKKALVHQNAGGTGPDLTGLQYDKGGMVLQVLRGQIGTDNFWKGIRLYYARHRDANATSDDLRRDMEAASGQDLDWFFTQWLARVDSPVINGDWSWDAAAGQIVINLAQTQAGAPYRLSLEIGVTPDSGTTRIEKIEMTQPQQRFVIAAAKAPKDLSLDPNTWILMEAKFVRR